MSRDRVVVAVRDKEHVEELMKLGCQIAKGKGAEIVAVSVSEISPTLPMDAEAPELDQPAREALERAAEISRDCSGLETRTRLVRARDAGPTIVDEAREQEAEYLVIGYHGRPGIIGTFPLGSCVHYVVTHAPCRVVLEIIPHPAASAA